MNDTVNSDMSEFWNGEGGKKWLRFESRTRESLRPFGKLAMAAATFSTGERVADVGCGCGDTTYEIGRLVEPGGHVCGFDISEPLVAHARKQAGAGASGNVTFKSGDAQIFPFEQAAFDVVFSRFGVMFFADPAAAFNNLRSALKPGGRLAFIAWQSAKKNEWVKLSLDVVAKHIALPPPPGLEDPGPFSFGDPARIKRILDRAGYSGIGIEGIDASFIVGETLDDATEFLTQMGPPGSAIAKSDASEKVKSRIASDMREALGGRETAQGVALGAATWVVTARSG